MEKKTLQILLGQQWIQSQWLGIAGLLVKSSSQKGACQAKGKHHQVMQRAGSVCDPCLYGLTAWRGQRTYILCSSSLPYFCPGQWLIKHCTPSDLGHCSRVKKQTSFRGNTWQNKHTEMRGKGWRKRMLVQSSMKTENLHRKKEEQQQRWSLILFVGIFWKSRCLNV